MSEVVAAITAGGRVDGDFARLIGTDVKALAPLGAERLIDPAICAARSVGVERLAVVGPRSVHDYCGERVDDLIDESPYGEENLRRALAYAGDAPLLLLTSDLPFIRGDDLVAFLNSVNGADAAMPLSAADDYESMFPGAPEHVVVLAGERMANGSVFYFGAGIAPRVERIAARLFTARKSLLRMALLLGPRLLVKFATRRLRIGDIEERAHALFRITVRAVRDASPRMCYDVDSQADYTYALERLRNG